MAPKDENIFYIKSHFFCSVLQKKRNKNKKGILLLHPLLRDVLLFLPLDSALNSSIVILQA